MTSSAPRTVCYDWAKTFSLHPRRGRRHGFASLGGVQSKIVVDNLKSAVLQRLAGTAPVFNPRYLDFARHHGFAIAACNVARGNEKGRVESGVATSKRISCMCSS